MRRAPGFLWEAGSLPREHHPRSPQVSFTITVTSIIITITITITIVIITITTVVDVDLVDANKLSVIFCLPPGVVLLYMIKDMMAVKMLMMMTGTLVRMIKTMMTMTMMMI